MHLTLIGLFRAKWSAHIHEEWMSKLLENRPDLMDKHSGDALVSGYEDLIPGLRLPDPDERHFLAAAIAGRADLIVTKNLRDFPAEAIAPFAIEVQHPDAFVPRLLDLAPHADGDGSSRALGLIRSRGGNHRSLGSPAQFISLAAAAVPFERHRDRGITIHAHPLAGSMYFVEDFHRSRLERIDAADTAEYIVSRTQRSKSEAPVPVDFGKRNQSGMGVRGSFMRDCDDCGAHYGGATLADEGAPNGRITDVEQQPDGSGR